MKYFCDFRNHIQVGCDLGTQICQTWRVNESSDRHTVGLGAVRLHKTPSEACLLSSETDTDTSCSYHRAAGRWEWQGKVCVKGSGVIWGHVSPENGNQSWVSGSLLKDAHHWRHFLNNSASVLSNSSSRKNKTGPSVHEGLSYLCSSFFPFLLPSDKASSST